MIINISVSTQFGNTSCLKPLAEHAESFIRILSGEQIYYLPRPKVEANEADLRNTNKSLFLRITEFSNYYNSIIKFVFCETEISNCSTTRGNELPIFREVQTTTHEQNIICSRITGMADGNANKQTIFEGSYCRSRAGLSANEKENDTASNDTRNTCMFNK